MNWLVGRGRWGCGGWRHPALSNARVSTATSSGVRALRLSPRAPLSWSQTEQRSLHEDAVLSRCMGNLGARTVCPSPSPSSSSSPSSIIRLLLIDSSGEAVIRLNGARRAHLPAVRDDRARAGVRLDAVPQTELQTPRAGCRCPAAQLQVCANASKWV